MDPKFEQPVQKEYDQQHLSQIAMPLGGIGTGTVSLGGRGNLCDWEITNRPRKGFNPPHTFFTLRCQKGNEPPVMRVLESELQPPFEHHRGFSEAGYNGYPLPRFKHGAFYAAYPFGQVHLSTPDLPLDVRMQGFNPMIPGDPGNSGIPVAVLRFVLCNHSSESVDASILGLLNNFIGLEYREQVGNANVDANVNHYRPNNQSTADLQGVFMEGPGIPGTHSSAGTMALVTLDEGQSINGNTDIGSWRPLEHLWRHFERWNDSNVTNNSTSSAPTGALSSGVEIPAGGTRTITMLLGWHFPNRGGFNPDECDQGCDCQSSKPGRNWYATQYSDAWEVVNDVANRLPDLETKTVEFVKSFIESDVPESIKEAALANTSTLRSTTCFRLEDGNFFGFEGSRPGGGCCPGSCTHVWAYETATPYLYGELSRSMRDVHFLYATDQEGGMNFRVSLPLHEESRGKTAADGQMSALIKLYLDWKLNGDTEWLQKLWPKAKAAMEFCWIKNGWDGDCDGVMEGIQHNTSDLELFGPNPLCTVWYLAALSAVSQMAEAVGDQEFAESCRSVYKQGAQWVDENLFNGEYYIQTQQNPPAPEEVPAGLFGGGALGAKLADLQGDAYIPQQIDNGCQSDQLVGQLFAHICDLGYVLKKENVLETLKSVYERNFVTMGQHAGFFRAFALNDEQGVLFGTYPEDKVPPEPLFRFSELWNGVEYAVAAHMIYEGLPENGEKIIEAVRDRHDGGKRNPFNEPECGNHYVRSMASWTCYLAWIGFDYDALTKTMQFNSVSRARKFFWSNGYAWGVAYLQPDAQGVHVTLRVLHDAITVKTVRIAGIGEWTADEAQVLRENDTLQFQVTK